jgi:hypothetical protein
MGGRWRLHGKAAVALGELPSVSAASTDLSHVIRAVVLFAMDASIEYSQHHAYQTTMMNAVSTSSR